MDIINSELISGKRVLLRYDIDVALEQGTGGRVQVAEDFKLKAGIPTLNLCLQNASSVVLMGHIGRPEGKPVPELSVAPIREWLIAQGYEADLDSQKLVLLENLRFDPRESFDSAQDKDALEFAKELVQKGDVYINEAFSSYRAAVSTTVLPTLLPHAAGLRFTEEVSKLTEVRENPKKPFIAVMGGAKVKDKLPVIEVLARSADAVLVGGKLISEIHGQNLTLPRNVMVGKLSEGGLDIAPETTSAWGDLISKAAMIVWNGPLGKFEDPQNDQTAKVAEKILDSGAEIIIGGGDSVAALTQAGLFEKAQDKAFVSVGGGAMLKFLSDGTLPTIEVLK